MFNVYLDQFSSMLKSKFYFHFFLLQSSALIYLTNNYSLLKMQIPFQG